MPIVDGVLGLSFADVLGFVGAGGVTFQLQSASLLFTFASSRGKDAYARGRPLFLPPRSRGNDPFLPE